MMTGRPGLVFWTHAASFAQVVVLPTPLTPSMRTTFSLSGARSNFAVAIWGRKSSFSFFLASSVVATPPFLQEALELVHELKREGCADIALDQQIGEIFEHLIAQLIPAEQCFDSFRKLHSFSTIRIP